MQKSLQQLINECGNSFASLIRETIGWDNPTTSKWCASSSYSGTVAGFGIIAYGSTPAKAVQNLLEILEKNKEMPKPKK